MAPQNPIPQGTAYTFMLPWVDKSCKEKEIQDTFESVGWGNILKIDMIFKSPIERKPGHYKVFVHMASLNPLHSMVFEHLDAGLELRVNHRHGYWKVRRSQWAQRSKVEFAPMAPPPLPPKLWEMEYVCPPIMESFVQIHPVSPVSQPSSPYIIAESTSWGDIPMESEPSSPAYNSSKSWANIV